MNDINNARILLVAGAVVAMIGAGVLGYWTAVAVLGLGVVVHGLLWYHLYGPSKGRRGGSSASGEDVGNAPFYRLYGPDIGQRSGSDGTTPEAPRPR